MVRHLPPDADALPLGRPTSAPRSRPALARLWGAREGGARWAPDAACLLEVLERVAGSRPCRLDLPARFPGDGLGCPAGLEALEDLDRELAETGAWTLLLAGAEPLPPRLLLDGRPGLLILRDLGPEGAVLLGDADLLAGLDLPPEPSRPPSPRPSPDVRPLLALDVDGVLIDPGRSFAQAVQGALAELAPGLAWNDGVYQAFKRAGGFNNDFRLAAGALALAEQGWKGGELTAEGVPARLEARVEALEPRCQEAVQRHYAGSWRLERPLVGLARLRATGMQLGIYTGRPPEELEMAFQVLGFRLPGISDRAPHLRKPRGGGLLQLAEASGSRQVVFVGDTLDDAAALREARELRPGVDWRFVAVGEDRRRIAAAEDLQVDCLEALLPMLGPDGMI